MNAVELRQLVYFEAVARCGGFTRAAEDLHIAQPALSAQVRRLESELGVTLLARTTRRVALTEAGELVLARARRVLAEIDGVQDDIGDLTAVLRGTVALGVTELLGPVDLPAVLAGFGARYPGVGLTLRSGLIAVLLSDLDSAALDLVLGPIHDGLASRFTATPLFGVELVLVTPPGHVLAGRDRVPLSDLRDEPWVGLAPGSGLRTLLDVAAHDAGFEPDVRFQTHGPASIRSLVAAGLGIGVIARSVATAPGPPVAVVELADPPPHPPVGLIRHRDRRLSPAVRALATRFSGRDTG